MILHTRGMPPQRAAFTLIELLIVVAIVGLLLGMLLPAVQNARETSRRMQCQNHLKQLALAAHHFHDNHGHFPSGMEQDWHIMPPVHRGFSLFVFLLPYLEQSQRRVTWEMADPLLNTQGGSAANTAQVLPALVCPSDVLPHPTVSVNRGWVYALTSYGGNGGIRSYFPELSTTDGIFFTTGPASEPIPHQQAVRMREIRDGLSQTILLGERSHDDPNFASFSDAGWCDALSEWGWWAASGGRKSVGHVTLSGHAPINYRLPFHFAERDTAIPPASAPNLFQYYVDLRVAAYGSMHPVGANFALADGSVRFITDDVPLFVLQSLCTRNGGEIVNVP